MPRPAEPGRLILAQTLLTAVMLRPLDEVQHHAPLDAATGHVGQNMTKP